MIKDDELCSICSVSKADHDSMNHEFNTEERLIPKKSPPAISVRPNGTANMEMVGAVMRLMHKLVQKGVLNDDDVRYITGGLNGGSSDSRRDNELGSYTKRPRS